MVSKPDGTSRMCVDFRSLNACTLDVSWPIPNIIEMLRGIGAQYPTIFGVMDLTQGYHVIVRLLSKLITRICSSSANIPTP